MRWLTIRQYKIFIRSVRYIIAISVLFCLAYNFRNILIVSRKYRYSFVDLYHHKAPDNEMIKLYNQSMKLYTAFINEIYDVNGRETTEHPPYSGRYIVILAWQKEHIIEDTYKCCIWQGKDTVVTSESTKSDQCCYNRGRLRARRIECPIGNISELKGVSLAKWDVDCPNDEQYYITPTILYPSFERNKWAVCNKYLYGPGPNARRLVEWVEIHRVLGVDKFTIHHEATINSATKKVLKYYQQSGLVEALQITAPFKDTINRNKNKPRSELFNDEQVGLWDCRERNKYYEYAADIDTDEFILPMYIKENAMKEILVETFSKKSVGVATFFTYIHMTSWDPTNATYPLFVGQYAISTEPLVEAPKNMYMGSKIMIAEGTIHTVYPRQPFTKIYMDPRKAAVHHFRPCRPTWHEPFVAKIYRNETIFRINITCNTFPRIQRKLDKGEVVENIKRTMEKVFSELRI